MEIISKNLPDNLENGAIVEFIQTPKGLLHKKSRNPSKYVLSNVFFSVEADDNSIYPFCLVVHDIPGRESSKVICRFESPSRAKAEAEKRNLKRWVVFLLHKDRCDFSECFDNVEDAIDYRDKKNKAVKKRIVKMIRNLEKE